MSVFTVRRVDFRYPGGTRDAVHDVSLAIPEGGFVALLGPNGSGKSTLLKLLLGELARSAGEIRYRERPIEAWSRREVARRVAFVPQSEPLAFPMTVRALVQMGRYPHVGVLGRSGSRDLEAVEAAMAQAGVLELAERSVTNLSGGERQRARIARALAQEPSTLVLDEPTAALDLHYEMETFELLRRLSRQAGFTVLVATHNLNLAARYASDLALLANGELQSFGAPERVLERETIERVYRWPVVVASHPGPGPDAAAPQVIALSRESS